MISKLAHIKYRAFGLLLRSEGYKNVKAVSDSRHVLKHQKDLKNPMRCKLAILDIRIPDINGIQLSQILKIMSPYTIIMFLTALDAVDELASICPEVKPKDILRKPVYHKQFTEAVNEKVEHMEIQQ